jgi:peptidoglycan/LPS O-acetylase OafA/YrhL
MAEQHRWAVIIALSIIIAFLILYGIEFWIRYKSRKAIEAGLRSHRKEEEKRSK